MLAGDDAHFSPLASGLRAPSFTAGMGLAVQQVQQQQPCWHAGSAGTAPAGADKQRRHLRHAAAFRLAAARHRGVAASAALDACTAAAGAAALAEAPGSSAIVAGQPPEALSAGQPVSAAHQPPLAFCSQVWQAITAPAQSQPAGLQTALSGSLTLQHGPALLASCSADADAAPARVPQPLQQARQRAQQGPAGASVARCSTGQDMETDLRSSWGSERSAEVANWQHIQAQTQERACAEDGAGTPHRGCSGVGLGSLGGRVAGVHRQSSMATEAGPSGGVPRALARGTAAAEASSQRSSLDGPACSDRQASLLPLRASVRPHQWGSHMPSPPGCDGASPDPLLSGHCEASSGGSSRQRAGRSSGNSVGGWARALGVEEAGVRGPCHGRRRRSSPACLARARQSCEGSILGAACASPARQPECPPRRLPPCRSGAASHAPVPSRASSGSRAATTLRTRWCGATTPQKALSSAASRASRLRRRRQGPAAARGNSGGQHGSCRVCLCCNEHPGVPVADSAGLLPVL